MIFARKINEIPEFYMIYHICLKKLQHARILHDFARKIFFPNFFFGGGRGASTPLPPVSYAYVEFASFSLNASVT